MRLAPLRILALLALSPALAIAAPLVSGVEQVFSLPGRSLAPDLYIDVPADAAALRVEIESATAGRDLDLLLRTGSPFQVGAQPDPATLFDQAQYSSGSVGDEEYLVVSRTGRTPLAEGRWYVGVLNFSQQSAEVRVRATVLDEVPVAPIEVVYDAPGQDCDVAPWSADRKAAMDRAAELLTEQLRPQAPVRVRACWIEHEKEGVLASAGPTFLYLNQPGLTARYTYFVSAAAAHMNGTSSCHFSSNSCGAGDFDIVAYFNKKANFHYGLDEADPPGLYNFITVAMHEITHGLGFSGGLVDVETGELATPYTDAFIRHARWDVPGAEPVPIVELSDEERQQAFTSVSQLRFHGPNVKTAVGSSLRLYAPSVVNAGSTFAHLDTTTMRSQLMAHSISPNARHDLGLALPVLFDVGWDPDHGVVPEPLLPRGGQFYDTSRSGHGIAMYRVAGLGNFYFVVFYTYDEAGLPEYYVSSGYLVDGVFVPERNAAGDSLVRSLYNHGATPPGYHDASAEFQGLLRIDFNDAAMSPACAGRDAPSAVMNFTLPGSANQAWCLQSLADTSTAANDLTNVWLVYGDTGWGASSLSFGAGSADGMGLQLYYPDAAGYPRWAIMQTGDYTSGASYPLMQPRGYCRTCPSTSVVFEQVGTITLGMDSDAAGSSAQLEFEVNFSGPAGGSFMRDTEVVPGGEADG